MAPSTADELAVVEARLRSILAPYEGRLEKAGYTGRGLFNKKALRELFRVTEGTPRLINVVCDGAMLLGYARQQTAIGADAILEVARDLGLVAKDESEEEEVQRGASRAPNRRSLRRFFGFGR